MKRYFNTREKAQEHLEYRKKCAYTRIEKRGDKVLGEASFVCQEQVLQKHFGKWYVFLLIYTEEMMKDLSKIHGIDYDIKSLIPFTHAEKIMKNQQKMKKVEQKYKTLDIEDYTINKDL